jgi:hypothetical protein
MLTKIKVVNGWDTATEDYSCNYGCGRNIEETEISETPYATYVCGDIECWNNLCLEFWSPLDVEEKEVEACDDCEEKIEECYCESEEE